MTGKGKGKGKGNNTGNGPPRGPTINGLDARGQTPQVDQGNKGSAIGNEYGPNDRPNRSVSRYMTKSLLHLQRTMYLQVVWL